MRKLYSIIILLLSAMIMFTVCACGSSEAKAVYKPPARVFDVEIEGTSEPKIDGVEITYDSKARIDTVSYSIDGYDYKQEYSYDTDQIVIKTIYKTEVIEEKVIKYVDIPVESGFVEVDGYIINVTEDMPIDESDSNDDNTGADNDSPSNDKTEKATNPQKSADWKGLYKSYLEEFMKRDDLYISQFKDNLIYSLIYIDNDDIPELFITGTSHLESAGSVLCWISDGAVSERDSMSSVTYIEKSGLLHQNSGWTGRVYDSIFRLEDGDLSEIVHGDMSIPDNRYTWNDADVSESEYNTRLNAAFDTTIAKNAAENTCSYSQMLEKLR